MVKPCTCTRTCRPLKIMPFFSFASTLSHLLHWGSSRGGLIKLTIALTEKSYSGHSSLYHIKYPLGKELPLRCQIKKKKLCFYHMNTINLILIMCLPLFSSHWKSPNLIFSPPLSPLFALSVKYWAPMDYSALFSYTYSPYSILCASLNNFKCIFKSKPEKNFSYH